MDHDNNTRVSSKLIIIEDCIGVVHKVMDHKDNTIVSQKIQINEDCKVSSS